MPLPLFKEILPEEVGFLFHFLFLSDIGGPGLCGSLKNLSRTLTCPLWRDICSKGVLRLLPGKILIASSEASREGPFKGVRTSPMHRAQGCCRRFAELCFRGGVWTLPSPWDGWTPPADSGVQLSVAGAMTDVSFVHSFNA